MQSRELFDKLSHNLLVTSDAHDGEYCIWSLYALPNVLLVMTFRWIVGIVKILINNANELEEITTVEVYFEATRFRIVRDQRL